MMTDEQEQEKISHETQPWIGQSILIENFEDIYDLDIPIHQGDFADVFQCRLKNRQTVRAVKHVPKKGQRKTPIRLASKVLQLDHPNLVVLRDIFETETDIYIVQDFVIGPNLFQKITQLPNYTEHDVSKYCQQILKGLQYMHERNVFHGKLHGENILVHESDQGDRLCLVDYALSNLLPHHVIHQLVNTTPSFCAPETLRGEPFSATTDAWQLGILIYFLLTGTYPFHGTPKQIFHQILNGKIDYNTDEWEHVSSNGQDFVSNLLKINVKDRLTINRALSHPWIRTKVYRADNLIRVQNKITSMKYSN